MSDQQDGDLSWAELVGFLNADGRKDILVVALRYIHGLSGAATLPPWLGCEEHQTTLISRLIDLLTAKRNDSDIVSLVLEILINFSAHEVLKAKMLTKEFLQFVSDYIAQDGALLMELFGILTNLTISPDDLQRTVLLFKEIGSDLSTMLAKIVEVSVHSDTLPQTQVSAGSLLRNLTQLESVRQVLLESKGGDGDTECMFESVYQSLGAGTVERRLVTLDVVKNMCQDHEFLKVPTLPNFLSALLWPLIGPEELDEEDNEQLPIDLQYMTPDKSREPDRGIRFGVLEVLHRLCHVGDSRKYLRENGTYYVLREYHKWEKDEEAITVIEDVVSILTLTEDEING